MTNVPFWKVIDKVNEVSVRYTDRVVDVHDISFESLEWVIIAGERHFMKPIAQRAFCYRLGIPHQYLSKCPGDLQCMNMNTWLEKEKNPELLFRFNKDDVRAIFTRRYKPVDNLEILQRLNALGYGPDTTVQFSLDEEFMLLSIPDTSGMFVINGDRVMPGICISNSEVGLRSLSIEAYFLRLICTNGLIAKTEMGASYRHVSSKVIKEIPEIMEKISFELSAQKSKFRIMMESRVSDPYETMMRFNRQFALSQPEKEAVEWGWGFEAGDTMFHIVNAYTRGAQFPGLSTTSRYTLQKVGGNILGLLKLEGS